MSQEIVQMPTVPKLPSIMSGNAVKPIVPNDFDSAWRIANAIVQSGMAPRGIDSAEKAMIVIMHGLEVGMTPMMALQSIASINGRPSIYGDGALGLVQGSGLMEWYEEIYEGDENTDGFKAVCRVKRKGDPKVKTGEFSIGDAKLAKLYAKTGPWQEYRKRMLKMRARAFALRDGFSDVLRGLHIAEEAQDIAPAKDITPRDAGPPAPPVASTPVEKIPPAAAVEPQTAIVAPVRVSVAAEAILENPDELLKWIETKLAAVSDVHALETVWNDEIEPRLESAFPPDRDEALAIFARHERRLGID